MSEANGDGHVKPQMSPATWGLTRVGEQTNLTGETEQLWALTIYTVVGPCVTFWTAGSLARFSDRVREVIAGLTVVHDLPPEFRSPGA